MTRLQKLFVLICLSCVALTANAEIDTTLSPPALDLGDVNVGSTVSGDATIGITFNGNGDLNGNANNGTVTSVAITNLVGGDLTASQTCVGVDFSAARPTQECIVQVSCTPGAAGSISGVLEVQFDLLNNSGTQTTTSNLTCNGVLAPPGPGGAVAIPTTSFYGLAILSFMLAAFGWMGLRRKNRQ